MDPLRRLRTRISLLAAFALLLHALAPALPLARAEAQGQTGKWIEVCTGHGQTRLVPASALGASDGKTVDATSKLPDAAVVTADCSLCSHHGPVVPRMESGGLQSALSGGRQSLVRLIDTPDPQFAWAAERSRGPPS